MAEKLRIVVPTRREQLDDLSDDELMLLSAGGQEAAFETLVTRHQSLLLGYATAQEGLPEISLPSYPAHTHVFRPTLIELSEFCA